MRISMLPLIPSSDAAKEVLQVFNIGDRINRIISCIKMKIQIYGMN